MKNLNAFLKPIKIEEKEVVVSNRFIENGKVVPFVIKPITEKQNEKIIKASTKNNSKGSIFDQNLYMHLITATAVIFPDLKNAELQNAYNVIGEVELLNEMLYSGEFAVLAGAVQELSGFDTDLNGLIEEAKN